jgi:folate-binding protein YgfZ
MASKSVYRFPPAAVLRFTGEDHFDFLQGQGTADLRGSDNLCRYSLWLDHKGLIQADGFVLKESEEAMLLVSYASPAEELRAKFDRHIIADDVEMEDLTGQYEMVSFPAGSEVALPGLIEPGSLTSGIYSSLEGGYCYLGRRLGPGTIDCLIPSGTELTLAADWMDRETAERLRIAGGIPLFPVDAADKQLHPLEVNVMSALSFDKGCYLGQEVVARVHRLERWSRRLVRFSASEGSLELPFPLALEEAIVGGVTSVVNSPDGFIAIGWLKTRVPDGDFCFGKLSMSVESLGAS